MKKFVLKHIERLLAFAEGKIPLDEWRRWVDENVTEIEMALGRHGFIKLKYRSYDKVSLLLKQHKIAFKEQKDLCQRCGARLFHAIPGKTSKQEIIDFATSSKLRYAEEIIRDGWIHPGTYCPNECVMILRNYGSGGFKRLLDEISDN